MQIGLQLIAVPNNLDKWLDTPNWIKTKVMSIESVENIVKLNDCVLALLFKKLWIFFISIF